MKKGWIMIGPVAMCDLGYYKRLIIVLKQDDKRFTNIFWTYTRSSDLSIRV